MRRQARDLLLLVVLWAVGGALALAAIVGGTVGSGFLSVALLSPEQQGDKATAASIDDAVYFLAGAFVGGVVSFFLVIGAIALLWEREFSSIRDSTLGAVRRRQA